MEPKTYRQKAAQTYAALGHVRRLRILEELEGRPNGLSFEQIGMQCKINGSTLGFHIKCLAQAGFLKKTIKGPYSIYRYNPAPLKYVSQAPAIKRAA